MMLNFLEDVGIVKTERKEAESLYLARALFHNRKMRPRNRDKFLKLAQKNKVTLRAAPLLDAPPETVDEAKTDASEAMQLYELMSKEFTKEGVSFVVIKSFDSLPDMGHDLDFLLPRPKEFEAAKTMLLDRFKVSPQPLTHCDKLLGKFSCFLPGYKHDFELYPTISQLGEEHVEPESILDDRKVEEISGSKVWVTSPTDRVLIRVIHAMFRHNFLKLSDVIDFPELAKNSSTPQILDAVDSAGIGDAFTFFIGTIDRFLKACQADTKLIDDLKQSGEKRFGKDRLAFLRRDRLVLPYRIPTAAIMLLFLLKGARSAARGRWHSALMCIVTPPLMFLDFVNNVFGNRLLFRRIW
ncbi:MAG TPA: hypothetical protein VE955_07680 [Candidatus Dormibacteraeota bacterium]|jgi:hypothetical protein|nr:hypothetical protein [Candidatus Dormibacteraeota bacterium]